MSDLTVADELALDALDEQTRKLCDKIIESRSEDANDAYDKGYEKGYARGRNSVRDENAEQEREAVKMRGQMKALEDQLTHAGITPNRQYGVPATTPPLDSAMFEAKPKPRPSTGEAAD